MFCTQMKNLTDYTKEAQTNLFEEKGFFFAFNNAQFEEQKKEWVTYTISNWMYCPKDELQSVLNALDDIIETGIKLDLKEKWVDKIIVKNYQIMSVTIQEKQE